MILRFIKNSPLTQSGRYSFASAAAAIDYYSLLGVQRGASRAQIQQAFARLTKNISPDNNSTLFSRLTQAFVILSDGKARDAYDSLMKVRKFSFMNDPAQKKPSTPSYIADRRHQKSKQLQKQYNVDKFGRYRGGVPRNNSFKRGKAIGQAGTLYHPTDFLDRDQFPEHTHVDTATAQSFKNFHQDQRVHRTAKPLWITLQVDYEFFSLKRFLNDYRFWKYFIFFFLLMPIFVEKQQDFFKRYSKWSHDRDLRLKAQKQAKQKQQKEKAARLKLEQQRAEQQKRAKQAQAQNLAKANTASE